MCRYEHGIGLQRDTHLAKRWYDKSGRFDGGTLPARLAVYRMQFFEWLDTDPLDMGYPAWYYVMITVWIMMGIGLVTMWYARQHF